MLIEAIRCAGWDVALFSLLVLFGGVAIGLTISLLFIRK